MPPTERQTVLHYSVLEPRCDCGRRFLLDHLAPFACPCGIEWRPRRSSVPRSTSARSREKRSAKRAAEYRAEKAKRVERTA